MSFSKQKLARELKELQQESELPFTVGLRDPNNLYTWDIVIIGQEDTFYENQFLRAEMTFPQDYPFSPPVFRFLSKMFHPNIYPGGEVCISILHPPSQDPFNSQELLSEKWKPVLGANEVILSILTLLDDPNPDSPANVEAGKLF